ncbi:hypothetical protein [Dactylosporangium sp. NPDC005555]|uniref:hypothetical protein n=1 Tax=Dactylosporangium sp. NPDC005555 TaxID=3154889 RepID=UPI0033BA41B8
MSGPSITGDLDPFTWNQREAVDYEVALELIAEAMAVYTALANQAEGTEAERLRSERARCVQDRLALRDADHATVKRVTTEYSDLIRRLREARR